MKIALRVLVLTAGFLLGSNSIQGILCNGPGTPAPPPGGKLPQVVSVLAS